MHKTKQYLLKGFIYLLLFLLFTYFVQCIDIQYIVHTNSKIGFGTINQTFHKLTGVHMWMYHISDYLSIIPLLICIKDALKGLNQWIKRRSLFKVDFYLIILGIYYFMIILIFLLFEKMEINYRPILIEGRRELSYPSSTTLLILTIMLPFIEQLRIKHNLKGKNILIITSTFFLIFMLLLRTFSGVHWLSDIIGSILLSMGLFYLYKSVIMRYNNDERGDHDGI